MKRILFFTWLCYVFFSGTILAQNPAAPSNLQVYYTPAPDTFAPPVSGDTICYPMGSAAIQEIFTGDSTVATLHPDSALVLFTFNIADTSQVDSVSVSFFSMNASGFNTSAAWDFQNPGIQAPFIYSRTGNQVQVSHPGLEFQPLSIECVLSGNGQASNPGISSSMHFIHFNP